MVAKIRIQIGIPECICGVNNLFIYNVPLLASNRAAAFLQLVKLNKALADAETTIKLKPQWEKVRIYMHMKH